MRSLVGKVDGYGHELGMTEVAEADELAAAPIWLRANCRASPPPSPWFAGTGGWPTTTAAQHR